MFSQAKTFRRSAWLSLAFGFLTLLYTWTVLKPKLDPLNSEARLAIDALKTASAQLRQMDKVASLALTSTEDAAIFFQGLPKNLRALQKTLKESSTLLNHSAETTQKVKHGLTGLVLPKEELNKDQASFGGTAKKVYNLGEALDELIASSESLSGSTTRFSNELQRLKDVFAALNKVLQDSTSRLDALSHALSSAQLPLQIALLVSVIACLYFGLAALLFGIAALVERN